MIEFILEGDGVEIILPINPANFKIETENNNSIVNVVGIGDIVVQGSTKLTPIVLESYFPAHRGIVPSEYVRVIKSWQENKAKIKLTVTEIDQESIWTIIEQFDYDRRAGEHEDIYYTLSLLEYRPYGAETIDLDKILKNKKNNKNNTQRNKEKKPKTGNTYKVKKGDSLWKITKQLSGDGAKWKELYNVNKSVIGNNPSLIYPETILKIPESWVSK